jgi:hypothetical protein
MKVTCPHCNSVLERDAVLVGTFINCDSCDQQFQVIDEDSKLVQTEQDYEELSSIGRVAYLVPVLAILCFFIYFIISASQSDSRFDQIENAETLYTARLVLTCFYSIFILTFFAYAVKGLLRYLHAMYSLMRERNRNDIK